MKLADWLIDNDVRRYEFAARIGVSPSYVTALCDGSVWPGHDVAAAVARETGGEVTPNDFLREPAARAS